MIRIYDGVLVCRQRLEDDPTGFALRNLALEAINARDLCVWVFDGANNNARRREIYPDYKMNREPPAEDVFACIRLWKALVRLTPAFSVEIDGWEADDVIAHLAIRYALQGHQVEIKSTDADYRQLEVIPGIRVLSRSLEHIPPQYIRLYKATVGDPSDNIKGVPGFGKKTFEDAAPTTLDALNAWFREETDILPEALPARVKNAMLADPDHYRAIYGIVGPISIDADLVNQNIVAGTSNYEAIDKILTEYLQ